MTVTEIAKTFKLQPKEIQEFILKNATFEQKKNMQTGEWVIPDDIDVRNFFAPLIESKVTNGHYEYKVIKFEDGPNGRIQSVEIVQQLNKLGKEGWRTVAAYTNTVRHKIFIFFIFIINCTMDEHVYVLERYVKH